jgi:hypothetical protein
MERGPAGRVHEGVGGSRGRRRTTVGVLTAIAVGLALVTATSSSAASYWTNCTVPDFSKSIHTHGVQCGVAHEVVDHALAKGQTEANANGVVVVSGFRCRVTDGGNGARPILCTKGSKAIRAPMP